MKLLNPIAVFMAICTISSLGICAEPDSSLPGISEKYLLKRLKTFENVKSDQNNALEGHRWQLRSRHLVFGLPRLIDDRHDFKPDGFDKKQPGITILVREGFVVAHFDRMKSPLWVAQLWTRHDFKRMGQVPSQDCKWHEDLELPEYVKGGTSYEGNKTELDRGHMARHAMNRSWGIDSSNWGCKMSNSTPQHKRINRLGSSWRTLEDEIRDIVRNNANAIDAVWTFSGTIFRDKVNPAGETPEDDFENAVRLPKGGFGIPDATYKIVCWFDENHRFQVRAYVFEQPHTFDENESDFTLDFELGDTKAPLTTYLVAIDEIEKRTGVDFFPMLKDEIEEIIEETSYTNQWGM
jgi:endonuclease G